MSIYLRPHHIHSINNYNPKKDNLLQKIYGKTFLQRLKGLFKQLKKNPQITITTTSKEDYLCQKCDFMKDCSKENYQPLDKKTKKIINEEASIHMNNPKILDTMSEYIYGIKPQTKGSYNSFCKKLKNPLIN